MLTLLVAELPIVVAEGDPKALQLGHGGVTVKYVLEVVDPEVVSTLTCPDVALGTSRDNAEAEAVSTSANLPLTKTLSFKAVGSKPLPLIVSVPPGETLVADSEPMLGSAGTVTVKFVTLLGVPAGKLAALEIEPTGELTVIAAVVAPLGTTAVIEVADTADTTAVLLPNDTVVFDLVPNPTPEIVTDVPTGPDAGEKFATAILDVADGQTFTPIVLPTAS